MKSSYKKFGDIPEEALVQYWKPDKIFPSLTTEDMDSTVDDILRIFQPVARDDSASESENSLPGNENIGNTRNNVRNWNLEELEIVQVSSEIACSEMPENELSQLSPRMDEKQRLAEKARQKAEETILNAQSTANKMIVQAQKEADQIHEEAREAGRLQAITELNKAVENAQIILDQMRVWRSEAVHHSEELIVDMIQKIAHLVFGEGVVLSNEALQENLNKVMKMSQSLGDLKVYLNPQDVLILDPEWRRFQESLLTKRIQIVPSETILAGGCYVHGEMGVVDARVETQLSAVLEALRPDPEKTEVFYA